MQKLAVYGGPKAVKDGDVADNWPPIDKIDRDLVMASLESGHHTYGPNCTALENEFMAWNGNKHAINANSGTAALHMGIASCGLGAGDHVLVTAYSWSSSATCIMHHNCIPVFVDINFDTMNIDENLIEAAITKKTRAIVAVHLHGLPCNMDKIMKIAKKHNLKVIEDACQAHGALFKGRKVGTFGDATAFSMNQNKCLCSGEGGIMVTDDEEVYRAARALWSFGETRTPSEKRDYHAYALGWMYRSSDLPAAMGRAQLTKLSKYIAIQRKNGSVLLDELQGVPGLIPPTVPKDREPNWYNFVIRIDMDRTSWKGPRARFRDAVTEALSAEGVPNCVWQHFILPDMTVFKAQNAYGQGCPWSCPYTKPVKYDVSKFPNALRHCETHTCIINPLRIPNGVKAAKAVARGVRKVFENLDQIDPDRILKKA